MFHCINSVLTVLAFSYGLTSAAQAHVMPWRDGESRMKGFGSCAKGPCTKRYNFSDSKPHHHHGKRLVVGALQHSKKCEAGRN